MPRGLATFLVLLAVWVLPGLLARLPPSAPAALVELADGSLDRNARRSALAIVLRAGRAPDATAAELLAGACAAIELEDRGGFLPLWARLDLGAVDGELLRRSTFGQAHLRQLVAGLRAEAVGDPDTARAQLGRAAVAARFAGAGLAGRLAAEAAGRLAR